MADSDDEDLEALKLAALRTLRKRKHVPSREEPSHNVSSRSVNRSGEKVGRLSDQSTAAAKATDSRSANTSRLNSRSNGDFDDLGDIDEYDVEIGLEPADTCQQDQQAKQLESAADGDAGDQLLENGGPELEDDYEQKTDSKAVVEVNEENELDYANGYDDDGGAVGDEYEGEYTANEYDVQVEPGFGDAGDDDSGPVRSAVKIVGSRSHRDRSSRDHSNSHSFASAPRRDARDQPHARTSKEVTHGARGPDRASEDTHSDRRGRGPVRARLHGGSGSGAAPSANVRNDAEFDLRAKLGPSQRDRRADNRMIVGTRVTVGAPPNNTNVSQSQSQSQPQPQRGRNRNWRWTFT